MSMNNSLTAVITNTPYITQNMNFRLRLDIGGANLRIQDKILESNGQWYVDPESGLDIETLLHTDTKGDTTYVFEVGISILIMLCLSIFAIKKGIVKTYRKEYIVFFILGILSTVITIKQFPWGIFEDIFQIIQFKWRMLLFSNFFLAIICAMNINMIIKNFNYKDIIAISTICILYTGLLMPLLPKNTEIQEIDQYAIGEVTENKRDTIVGMGKGEYLPVKSNENRKYLRTREDTIYIIEGVRNS